MVSKQINLMIKNLLDFIVELDPIGDGVDSLVDDLGVEFAGGVNFDGFGLK